MDFIHKEASKPKIILIGGGGHCKVVLSILKQLDLFEIHGIADKEELVGKSILNIKINATDQQLSQLLDMGIEHAFVTIGSTGVSYLRKRLYQQIKEIGFKVPVIVSRDAIISENVKIGEGSVVMPGAIINPDVRIGNNCIINTGTIIEHDCCIEDYVHLSPGVTMSGHVSVGAYSHIGTGTSIIQGKSIGEHTLVGAGAVVVNDIPSNTTAFGVPAKPIN